MVDPEVCVNKDDGFFCRNGWICKNQVCTESTCGDGERSNLEECDDGNNRPNDGCSPDCKLEFCGDGVKQASEECDDGNTNDGDGCSSQCKIEVEQTCGNGVREGSEECDDGNTVNGDGCNSKCMLERCGDGEKDEGEECDDGNRIPGDGCSPGCTIERCGDGVVQSATEECDDGNTEDGDGCSAKCTHESVCPNGVVEGNEQCDDGNSIDGDGCSSTCKLEKGFCGDGIAQAIEECDDGNREDGDGCSSRCTHETEPGACSPMSKDSEFLPARSSVIKKNNLAEAEVVYTAQLYQKFLALCGACHQERADGDFQIRGLKSMAEDFKNYIDKHNSSYDAILGTMTTDDLSKVMPPPPVGGGMPWGKRLPSDQMVVLYSQLQAWIDQGTPADFFDWEGRPIYNSDLYNIDEKLSSNLTNIGSCLPEKALLDRNQHQSQKMDAFFAKANDWPDRLSQTDLISMDSKKLAEVGVISYATTYELWADNAKKNRYFKLPYGEKIKFDEERQLFLLPENTRVYKTFLKQVKDKEGKVSYRKIETRVILTRQDEIGKDGKATVKALFGTYKWNDSETEAFLLKKPLRNGQPFADDLFVYDRDEVEAEKLKANPNPGLPLILDLFSKDLIRHYGIPGSQRCIHCHLGSLEENFVVGFSPLQIHRRPKSGATGVIKDVSESELSQLQRFMEMDLFSDELKSVEQIRLLEAPQEPNPLHGPPVKEGEEAKPRTARNEHEIVAQGYLLGNCAHCHNPRGYGSIRMPETSPLMNFHPLTKGGGIYQYGLNNHSPRTTRDLSKANKIGAKTRMPYITPSLYDATKVDSINDFAAPDEALKQVVGRLAPWRSLIFRNVHSAFTYSSSKDQAIYPHMPMHTQGYDCRIRDVFGKWMASIPATRRFETQSSSTGQTPSSFDLNKAEFALSPTARPGQSPLSLTPFEQPWSEVFPGDDNYALALEEAQKRVNAFSKGQEGSGYCIKDPGDKGAANKKFRSMERKNILDPQIVVGFEKKVCSSATKDTQSFSKPWVPECAHFLEYDFTEPVGDWQPRRLDWKEILSGKKDVLCADSTGGDAEDGCQKSDRYLEEVAAIEELKEMTLTPELVKMALEEVPFAAWANDKEGKSCAPEGSKSFAELEAAQRRSWMPINDSSQKVYFQSAGALIFKSVCAQCHGVRGDSEGVIAVKVNELSGGKSRVANFREGLFGPDPQKQDGLKSKGSWGDNVKRIFGKATNGEGGSGEDWAARYMAWMALGGTRSEIPEVALTNVNGTKMFGKQRSSLSKSVDGNMLGGAKEICKDLLLDSKPAFKLDQGLKIDLTLTRADGWVNPDPPILRGTADAEVWNKICTEDNPTPIRVLLPFKARNGELNWGQLVNKGSGTRVLNHDTHLTVAFLVKRRMPDGRSSLEAANEPQAKLLTHEGKVETGLSKSNIEPKCIPPSSIIDGSKLTEELKAKYKKALLEMRQKYKINGELIPFCPADWFAETRVSNDESLRILVKPQYQASRDEVRRWVARAAANAGFVVYAYVKALVSDDKVSLPKDYDHCQK